MKSFLFYLAIIISIPGFSQVYDPERVSARALKTYEQALDLLKDDQISEAIPLLMQSIAE